MKPQKVSSHKGRLGELDLELAPWALGCTVLEDPFHAAVFTDAGGSVSVGLFDDKEMRQPWIAGLALSLRKHGG